MSEQERAAFQWPAQEHGIAPDNKGHVWLCGNGRDQTTKIEDNHCLKFTEDGKFVMQVGKAGASKGSLDMENFKRASQPVYWAKTNEVFVSDGYGNRRVVVMDADTGKFKRTWGAYGKKPDDSVELVRQYDPAPTQFNLAHALAMSNDGIVYLSDRNNNRIQSFSLDGKFLKEGVVQRSTPMDRGFGTVFSAALSGDPEQRFLYVADGRQQKVRVLDRKTLEEIPAGAFGRVGQYPGQFLGMHVIATDPQGNIYVGDGRDGRVQKFVFKGLSK
jgi:DNA-binding beta-propeller fold protein YncE